MADTDTVIVCASCGWRWVPDDKRCPNCARTAGMIDGLSTAYAIFINTGKRRALKMIDDQITDLRQSLSS